MIPEFSEEKGGQRWAKCKKYGTKTEEYQGYEEAIAYHQSKVDEYTKELEKLEAALDKGGAIEGK